MSVADVKKKENPLTRGERKKKEEGKGNKIHQTHDEKDSKAKVKTHANQREKKKKKEQRVTEREPTYQRTQHIVRHVSLDVAEGARGGVREDDGGTGDGQHIPRSAGRGVGQVYH